MDWTGIFFLPLFLISLWLGCLDYEEIFINTINFIKRNHH